MTQPKKIFLLAICLVLVVQVLSFVSATDIGIIMPGPQTPSGQIINALNELNYSYEIIAENSVPSANLSQYRAIIVGDGRFSHPETIPFYNYKSLIINSNHGDEFGWGTSVVRYSSPTQLTNNPNLNSTIKIGIPNNFNAYSQSNLNAQTYALSGRKPTGIKILSYKNTAGYAVIMYLYPGGTFTNNKVSTKRSLYFGIADSTYWSADSKQIFKNSLQWIIVGEDKDNDGYYDDVDCNDNNPSINPGAIEIPYDGLDNDCVDGDLKDVDGDGYDAIIVGGNDCNDDNSSLYQNLEGYLDNDRDGFGAGELLNVCSGENLLAGYSELNNDCNDLNPLQNPASPEPENNCVNDAPEILGEIPNLVWEEDDIFEINLSDYFYDVDSELVYGIAETSNDGNITAFFNGSIISFSSSENWHGEDWIRFNVSDGDTTIISNLVNLSVIAVNDAPTIETIENIQIIEGGNVSIVPSAFDIEGDNISFYFSYPLSEEGKWSAKKGDAGEYEIEVIASDGELIASTNFTLTVVPLLLINEIFPSENGFVEIYNPYNKIFSFDGFSIEGENGYAYNLSGTIGEEERYLIDEIDLSNEEILTLKYKGIEVNRVDYANRIITGLIPWSGENQSVGRIPDGSDNWEILETPTPGLSNEADMISPEIILISPSEDDLFYERNVEFGFNVSDNSDEVDCYFYVGENGNLSFVENKIVETKNGTSEENFEFDFLKDGNYSWNVECRDSRNSAYGVETNFYVDVPESPVLNPIGNKAVVEGEKLEFEVNAIDPEGDEIFYSVNGLPAGASFENKIFSWTPNYEQAGNYALEFIVSDVNSSSSEEINVNVLNQKEPPQFSDSSQCLEKNSNINLEITSPRDGKKFEVGDNIETTIRLENNLDSKENFDLEVYLYDIKNENELEMERDSVKIESGKNEKLDFSISIPEDLEVEDGEFVIYAYSETSKNCSSVYKNIEIERPDKLLKISKINFDRESFSAGDEFNVGVKVENIGADAQDVIVSISNEELNISYKSKEVEIEEFGGNDRKTFEVPIKIPSDAEGSYEFKVKISEEVYETFTINIAPKEIIIQENKSNYLESGKIINIGNNLAGDSSNKKNILIVPKLNSINEGNYIFVVLGIMILGSIILISGIVFVFLRR